MSVGSAIAAIDASLGPPAQKVYYLRVGHHILWGFPSNAGGAFNDHFAVVQTYDANGLLNALVPGSRTIGGRPGVGELAYGLFQEVSGVFTKGNTLLETRSSDQSLDWPNLWNSADQLTYALTNNIRTTASGTTPANSPPLYFQWELRDNLGEPGAVVREVRVMFLSAYSYSTLGLTIELLDINQNVVWRHSIGSRNVVQGPITQWTGAFGGTGTTRVNRLCVTPK